MKVKTREIQHDTTIRLRFSDGWAAMTFQHYKENDWWQVVISSDWGNWSHGWGRQGSGADIFEFMSGCNLGYFCNKFFGSEEQIFSPEKSSLKIRKFIRKEVNYWKDREKFKELIQITKELERFDNDRDYMNELSNYDSLLEVIGDSELWCWLRYEHKPRTVFFFKKIFPIFLTEIRKINKANKRLEISQ